MSWGSNWGFGATSQQEASSFLSSGNYAGYNSTGPCTSSSQCGSGYTCSGGRCVPRLEQQSSDGTTGGCGNGDTGGGCNAAVTVTQGMTAQDAANRGYSWSGGVGTKQFEWVPVYSADGCTIAGCSLRECGSENAQDCPGARQCRYDAYGNIRCYCGEPQQQGCSKFCTSYQQSYGETADGCSGLACDECSFCEEYNVFASGACKPSASGPCHCQNTQLDSCEVCNEDGSIGVDTVNCGKCVELLNYDCGFLDPQGNNVAVNATCCYSLDEWDASGLSPVNKCQNAAKSKCDEIWDKYYGKRDPNDPSSGGDPCAGTCTSERLFSENPCPDPPVDPPVADGHKSYWTGCIEAEGAGSYTLYYDCDLTDVPDKCKACDCNCHNDCPNCQLCGADGKCYPDPSCPTNPTTVTITTFYEQWTTTFDCLDCSGSTVSGPRMTNSGSNTLVVSYADYLTATIIGCGDDDCETSCRYRTAGGKVWRTPGYYAVTNCENAPPFSGTFDCPNNVKDPCNAYNRPDLRYYSNSWSTVVDSQFEFS